MTARVDRLRARIASADLDGLLVVDRVNRGYLTGFSGSLGWALVTASHQTLVVDGRYFTQAAAQSPDWEIRHVEMGAFADGTAAAAAARGLGIARLGFEADKVTVVHHDRLLRALPEVSWKAASGHVEAVRRRKDAEEIALIERACRLAADAIDASRPLMRPGISERDLAWAIERHCREHGAQAMAFCLVGSGPRSALPHSWPTGRLLALGDLLLVDVGPIVDGYYGDMTRMFVIGDPAPWQREIHALALVAQRQALEACRPGITAGELDAVARDAVTRAGFGRHYLHLLGHGVGLHGSPEGPIIDRGVPDRLEADMVVTIEPGIYLEGRGGVRVEETVLVTADGCRPLTRSPHSLRT